MKIICTAYVQTSHYNISTIEETWSIGKQIELALTCETQSNWKCYVVVHENDTFEQHPLPALFALLVAIRMILIILFFCFFFFFRVFFSRFLLFLRKKQSSWHFKITEFQMKQLWNSLECVPHTNTTNSPTHISLMHTNDDDGCINNSHFLASNGSLASHSITSHMKSNTSSTPHSLTPHMKSTLNVSNGYSSIKGNAPLKCFYSTCKINNNVGQLLKQ